MTSEIAVREAFHLLFLERLFATSSASQYVLKGGANLRFFFGSPRYSEDMDLDVVAGNVPTLKKNGFKILDDGAFRRSLQAFGVADLRVSDPAKAKQTETTQRFRLRLVTTAGIELPTKVEFSRRPSQDPYRVVVADIPGDRTRPYGRLGFPCPHYDGATAALQKGRALPGRDTPQCRDVFDLYMLWLGGHATPALVGGKLPEEVRADARAVIDGLEYDEYKGQVVEFLEDDARRRYGTEAAWDEMRLRVLELFDD